MTTISRCQSSNVIFAAIGVAWVSVICVTCGCGKTGSFDSVCKMEATFTVSDRGGRRTGSATSSANAAGGYIPVYFTASGVGQPAGTPFTAYLIGSEREGVITVPVSALSEQQGTFFVYLHTGGEHFAKQPVTIGESDGLRAEITGGLEPGSVVVTEGVSAVRLAETSAVAPQGHTHNH